MRFPEPAIRAILVAVSAIGNLALVIYFLELIHRTEAFTYSARVGSDVAMIVASTAALSTAAGVALLARQRATVLPRVLLVISFFSIVAYTVLTLAERFVPVW